MFLENQNPHYPHNLRYPPGFPTTLFFAVTYDTVHRNIYRANFGADDFTAQHKFQKLFDGPGGAQKAASQ
jgi:hypothetical protein